MHTVLSVFDADGHDEEVSGEEASVEERSGEVFKGVERSWVVVVGVVVVVWPGTNLLGCRCGEGGALWAWGSVHWCGGINTRRIAAPRITALRRRIF